MKSSPIGQCSAVLQAAHMQSVLTEANGPDCEAELLSEVTVAKQSHVSDW